MDPQGHIYEDDPEKVPAEDKARLEGYRRELLDARDKTKVLQERLKRLMQQERAVLERLANTPEQED